MQRSSKRKSLFSLEDLDFTEFLKPYENFQKEYEEIIKKNSLKAYKVTFKGHDDLIYFTFAKNKDKAKGEATKFFKENFHPAFMGRGWRNEHLNSRGVRIPELDKYARERKVPIPELMKYLKVSFHCSLCGKETFNYKDYENKRCFIIEGEGDLNEKTKGYILCYNCYKKYVC